MSEKTLNLGKHVFLDLYDCDSALLNDITALEKIMLEAAHVANATVIKAHFHQFSPQGISGSVIIAESHFNIHSWPEHGYAAVDLFTCGTSLQDEKAVDYLVQKLNSARHETKTVKRGVISVSDIPT